MNSPSPQRFSRNGRQKLKTTLLCGGCPCTWLSCTLETGIKVLENNSRPGDPEIINILPVLKEDFVDVCFKILDGNLKSVELEKAATVLTYKVPPNYGGYADVFPSLSGQSGG